MQFKLLPLILVTGLSAAAQSNSLPAREVLTYTIEWRLITAGKARMEWAALPEPRSGFQADLQLRSTGLVSKLYKVENDYSALLNSSLCAQSSTLISNEGSRHRETRVTYDAESKKANYHERDRVKNTVVLAQEIDIPTCTHEIVGALYQLRSLNLEPGQNTQVPVSDGKKSVMARVEAQQREDVKTPAGRFNAVRYEVFLFNNVLYRRPARLYVWLTDDRRKIPVQVRVRMQFTIGTITLLLEKME